LALLGHFVALLFAFELGLLFCLLVGESLRLNYVAWMPCRDGDAFW